MKKTKLTFIADTHHYSKTLGITGHQYELREGSDQKCLKETGEIIDSAFDYIKSTDTDAVLIVGDVSNDGEMVSHNEFREKIYELQKSKPVYITTATHDWCCDENPRRFEGDSVFHDVETMKKENLDEFYKDFGLSQSIESFKTDIGVSSYVVKINDKVRILGLNDDKNGKGKAGFTKEHLDWIKNQVEKAKEENSLIIGMEHHLIMPSVSKVLTSSCLIGDYEEVSSFLADAGLKYMFVGHSHITWVNKFKSQKGNEITQINVGSLSGYPCPIVEIEVNDDFTLNYNVKHLEKFTYDGVEYDAFEYSKKHATALVDNIFKVKSKEEFAERLTALQVDGDKLQNLYIIAKPLIKIINTCDTKAVYKKLKHLGLGKYVPKWAVDELQHKMVSEYIDDVICGALDGGLNKHSKNSTYYELVMAIVSIPEKIFKKNDALKELAPSIEAAIIGSEIDSNHAVL